MPEEVLPRQGRHGACASSGAKKGPAHLGGPTLSPCSLHSGCPPNSPSPSDGPPNAAGPDSALGAGGWRLRLLVSATTSYPQRACQSRSLPIPADTCAVMRQTGSMGTAIARRISSEPMTKSEPLTNKMNEGAHGQGLVCASRAAIVSRNSTIANRPAADGSTAKVLSHNARRTPPRASSGPRT